MGKFEKLYESIVNETIINEASYKQYFNSSDYVSKKIKSDDEKDVYEITNSPTSQLFKGTLYVFKNGKAYIDANYRTYSNVKNKYSFYYDKNGKEIKSTSDKKEKEIFDKIDQADNINKFVKLYRTIVEKSILKYYPIEDIQEKVFDAKFTGTVVLKNKDGETQNRYYQKGKEIKNSLSSRDSTEFNDKAGEEFQATEFALINN